MYIYVYFVLCSIVFVDKTDSLSSCNHSDNILSVSLLEYNVPVKYLEVETLRIRPTTTTRTTSR